MSRFLRPAVAGLLVAAIAAAAVRADEMIERGVREANEAFDRHNYGHGNAILDDTVRRTLFDGVPRTGPETAVVYAARGRAGWQQRRYAPALADLKRAAELDPNNAYHLNQAAWVAAVAPDAWVRDGRYAVRTAQRAVELVTAARPSPERDRQLVTYLDTLAAAYAETKEFSMAERTQAEAVTLLRLNLLRVRPAGPADRDAVPEEQLLTEFQRRKSLYLSGKPYRDQ